jgi:methylated-DNA-[protein]-cysteine S-methyltransferase
MKTLHKNATQIFVGTIESPIGTLAFLTDDAALRVLDFSEGYDAAVGAFRRYHSDIVLDDRADPLGIRIHFDAYFSGDIHALEAIPAVPSGTPFQQSVWRHLRDIRAGTTTTYGAIANALGSPSSTRAVGAANGANPIPLVIPCHRVIGANGTLTGYGGGLHRKAWLLRHEGAEIPLFG